MRYFPELEWLKRSKTIKKKLETQMLLFEKLHSSYFPESNVTNYSNTVTLINVPLLVLRKIEYLQFTL